MSKLFIFVAGYAVTLITTGVAIVLTGGHPFSSMHGWEGVGALLLLLIGIAIIAGGLWALGRGSFDTEVLLGLVAAGTTAILLLGFVGLRWLTGPLHSLLDGGAIWWPVAVLIGYMVMWFIHKPSR
jgi:hypothetical protein